MRIEYKQIESLPALAWLADVSGGVASVLHGNGVERGDGFFVEGAWDGEFAEGGFLDAEWFCGSGGKLVDNRIVFSTPSHVTCGLFTAPVDNSRLLASNSLHFLCAYAGYRLDPQYPDYELDFKTILSGINEYKESVRVLGNDNQPVDVKARYFRTVAVDDAGAVAVSLKRKTVPFADFDDYYQRLCAAVGGMIDNAKDARRKLRYGVITTISRGYDAPCCAAIAAKFGCDTAVTFDAKGKYAEDNGAEVAEALGYGRVLERDPDAYMSRTDLVETEQLSSGEMGSDLCFIAFDEDFRGKLVFVGDRGDSVWANHDPVCNDEFKFNGMLARVGVSERRLWAEYVSVPLPLFGASAWTSIQRISQSEEMTPWRLGNGYDRPIPRRICEEAGVAREMFGVRKHGVGISMHFDNKAGILRKLSEPARRSFRSYLKEHGGRHVADTIRFYLKMSPIYFRQFLMKIRLRKLAVKIPFHRRALANVTNPAALRYVTPWASEVIRRRYEEIISKERA